MKFLSHTKPAQSFSLAPSASTTFKPAHKPKLTMIWVTEAVGDRIRLVARWTTQD